jgi:hypothetical protein
VAGYTIFSKIDLRWGYTQLVLARDRRYLSAFVSHIGVRQFTTLPFGLATGPSAFQQVVRKMLRGATRLFRYPGGHTGVWKRCKGTRLLFETSRGVATAVQRNRRTVSGIKRSSRVCCWYMPTGVKRRGTAAISYTYQPTSAGPFYIYCSILYKVRAKFCTHL